MNIPASSVRSFLRVHRPHLPPKRLIFLPYGRYFRIYSGDVRPLTRRVWNLHRKNTGEALFNAPAYLDNF